MPEVAQRRGFLLAIATELELRPILARLGRTIEANPWVRRELWDGCDVLVTGVGKANAAGAVARVLDVSRHAGVLNAGIAGALPPSAGTGGNAGARPPELGAVVLGTSSVFGDEGVATPTGFRAFSDLGFPLVGISDYVPIDPVWRERLRRFSDVEGIIATVSTCSGTDAIGRTIHARTLAICEACEGTAVGVSAYRSGVRFGELRVISNTTGDRENQEWAMGPALERLGEVIADVVRAGVLVGVGGV